MKILVTGGAGFIGSAFVRHTLRTDPTVMLINLDKLTYAGNLENLREVENDARHRLIHGDICDAMLVNRIFAEERPDAVVHLAAESHVDRSIQSAQPVFETNLRGTFVLLEAARTHGIGRFLHVSTDEVYGSIPEPLSADESSRLRPSSPYSAAKAGSDLLALCYYATHKLPVVVTRSSNNYGPYQFPEKLIPLMIANAISDQPLPVYGDGLHIRDWIHVDDHCRALSAVLGAGREGEIYNIGGASHIANLEVVKRIVAILGKPQTLIQHVEDRPGHDRRYSLSFEKLRRETGWQPAVNFDDGLAETIGWYCRNSAWVQRVRSGAYHEYYAAQYENRVKAG